MENRRRILRWLANSVVLCQNDVICEFHSPKTMELILVVVISAGMAGNSQNGVSRSLSVIGCAGRLCSQHHRILAVRLTPVGTGSATNHNAANVTSFKSALSIESCLGVYKCRYRTRRRRGNELAKGEKPDDLG